MQSNFNLLQYKLPKQRTKLVTSQPKYQSIIFLSQKMESIDKDRKQTIVKQEQHHQQGDLIRQKRIQRSLMRKIRNLKTEPDLELDLDANFTDKIKILRRPVYQSQNRRSVKKISRQIMRASFEYKSERIKPRKYQNSSNPKLSTTAQQQFSSKLSKNQIDHTMAHLNAEKDICNKSSELKVNKKLNECKANRAKTDLSISSPRKGLQFTERESLNHHTSKKWGTKSSFEKMEQDIEGQQPELNKKSKKSTNFNKVAYIPKNFLYMSMYLRLRDSKEVPNNQAFVPSNFGDVMDTLRNSNSGQQKPNTKKNVKHKRPAYGSFLPKQMGIIRNYLSLATQKIDSIQVERRRKTKTHYSRPKISSYLETQKLKAVQSKKHEIQGKGPTIKIDPW